MNASDRSNREGDIRMGGGGGGALEVKGWLVSS